MSKRKKSNSGRKLAYTETQARIDIARHVTNERGRTDGRSSQSAVSGVSPNLRRKTPSTFRSPSMTLADVTADHIPADASAHVTKTGKVKQVDYLGVSADRARSVGTYTPSGIGHSLGSARPKGLSITHRMREVAAESAKRMKRAEESLPSHGVAFPKRTPRKSTRFLKGE